MAAPIFASTGSGLVSPSPLSAIMYLWPAGPLQSCETEETRQEERGGVGRHKAAVSDGLDEGQGVQGKLLHGLLAPQLLAAGVDQNPRTRL